jgi:hypothetical protein
MKLISFFLAATALICVIDRSIAQTTINDETIIIDESNVIVTGDISSSVKLKTEIKLRNLEIGVWGEYPQELSIEFITTNNLTIDGKSVEAYSGIKNLAIAKSVELDSNEGSKTLFESERDPNLTRSQLIQVEATNPKTIGLSISTLER